VLDLGCGDGEIALSLAALRSDLSVRGMDVSVRERASIPVLRFDGHKIPLADAGVDFVLLCDVLHHVLDMDALLTEARRVAQRGLLLKDHIAESRMDRALLAMMDAAGNPAGVPQPHNYLSEAQWRLLWARVGLVPTGAIVRELGLYPAPLDVVCGRGLHFIARLERSA
jgi:SAM-dependent methyltransferase